MLTQIIWGEQNGYVTKNGVLPVITLYFRKLYFNFILVDLMYQPPKCPYSYLSEVAFSL